MCGFFSLHTSHYMSKSKLCMLINVQFIFVQVLCVKCQKIAKLCQKYTPKDVQWCEVVGLESTNVTLPSHVLMGGHTHSVHHGTPHWSLIVAKLCTYLLLTCNDGCVPKEHLTCLLALDSALLHAKIILEKEKTSDPHHKSEVVPDHMAQV